LHGKPYVERRPPVKTRARHPAPHVLLQAGRHRAARGLLGALLAVHALQRRRDAGISAGECLDQRLPALHQRLYPRVRGVGARLALGLDLGDQLRPVVLRLAHPLLPQGLAARRELLELLRRVVLLVHRHHLDGLDELS